MEELDQMQINFGEGSLLLMNVSLAVIMFGVALEIKLSDFTYLWTNPKSFSLGIISQFILLPFLTLLLVFALQPTPSVALGMIMVAACPGGNISNFMTKLAGGNAALSVSLTAFASIAALIMTPLNFAIWGSFYEPTAEILTKVKVAPSEVARFVLLILGIPLIIGMVIKHYRPIFATKTSRFLRPVSILIFLLFIAGAFYKNLDIFLEHIHYVFLLVIAHNCILLLVGFYFAKLNKLSYLNQKTLSIETGIQNSGLGLLLVFSFFSGLGGMALFVAFWAIWDILSGLLIAFFWSDNKNPIKS